MDSATAMAHFVYNGILQIPPQMVSMTATINWQKQDGLRMMMETVMMLIYVDVATSYIAAFSFICTVFALLL